MAEEEAEVFDREQFGDIEIQYKEEDLKTQLNLNRIVAFAALSPVDEKDKLLIALCIELKQLRARLREYEHRG